MCGNTPREHQLVGWIAFTSQHSRRIEARISARIVAGANQLTETVRPIADRCSRERVRIRKSTKERAIMTVAKISEDILEHVGDLLPDLESIYKDIHSHPELSMEENRTAGIAADRLRAAVIR
jgi:hypothetical protein